MNINLHIERLVLEGIEIGPGQRQLLHTSVQTELARLLSEGGVASQLSGRGALPYLNSPAMQLSSGCSPTELGRQIAGAVYGGIGK